MFRISQKYSRNMKLIREAHTYYDVLRVKSNCTQKEIRESFIKLSKEHHPDTSSTVTLHTTRRFQKILEAYKILGKIESRCIYDAELRIAESAQSHSVHSSKPRHTFYTDFHPQDPPGASKRDSDGYYGLKGVSKVSNYVIVMLCLIFVGIGVALQVVAIRSSLTFKREKLEVQSVAAGRQHALVKDDASKHGNEHQLKKLRDKLTEK